MTTRTRRTIASISVVVGVIAVVLALSGFYYLGVAHAQPAGSGSAAAVVVPTTDNVLGDPIGTAQQIESLFRSGSFLAGGALLVFLVLAFLVKLDRKRAFYYTAGVTAVGVVVEGIANGRTPNLGMLVAVAVPFISIVIKGPELKKPEGAA